MNVCVACLCVVYLNNSCLGVCFVFLYVSMCVCDSYICVEYSNNSYFGVWFGIIVCESVYRYMFHTSVCVCVCILYMVWNVQNDNCFNVRSCSCVWSCVFSTFYVGVEVWVVN